MNFYPYFSYFLVDVHKWVTGECHVLSRATVKFVQTGAMKASGNNEFVSVLSTFTFRNGRISCNKDARNAHENLRVSRKLA